MTAWALVQIAPSFYKDPETGEVYYEDSEGRLRKINPRYEIWKRLKKLGKYVRFSFTIRFNLLIIKTETLAELILIEEELKKVKKENIDIKVFSEELKIMVVAYPLPFA